jgi:hypothetical protein
MAGRVRDPALEREIVTQNCTDRDVDEDEAVRNQLGTDDRFTGRRAAVPHDDE